MNKINIYEFNEPTILSIFVTIVASIGLVLFLLCPYPECLTYGKIYRWFLAGILYFWLERIYTNTWVFDMTCLKSQPRQMAFMVLIPYVQLFTPTASLVSVWQCADNTVSEREWKKARPSILLYVVSISIVVTAMINFLNLKYMDFFNEYIYLDSKVLSLHFIPWCIALCILMGIFMVWKFNKRQIEKHLYLQTTKNKEDNLATVLSDEQIKELQKIQPIPVEEPIPGVTNAKKNLKSNFIGTTILIWIHIGVLLLIGFGLYQSNQPSTKGEGSVIVYMFLLQLVFFSTLWIYSTHAIHNSFDITEKPIRPLYTFVCLLIPGCNLVYPSLKMMQIWKASAPESTRDNWKSATPSIVLIVNWVLLFVFSWRLIDAAGKNFLLNNRDNNIISITAILLLVTIITFMFQLKDRQKKKAIQLGLLPDKNATGSPFQSTEPSYFQKLD